MKETLLESIAAYMDKGEYVINDTIDHLTALGITVGVGGVVDKECREAYIEVRGEIIEHYLATREVSKERAENKAIEFLAECGYRLRKKKAGQKRTPTKWKKAVMKSVKYATKGDEIMIGDVVYKRA